MFGQRDDTHNSNGVGDASSDPGAPVIPTAPAVDAPMNAPMNTSSAPMPPDDFTSNSSFDAPMPPQPSMAPTMPAKPMSVPMTPAMNAPHSTLGEEATPEELIKMKQEALKHLQPLVGNLRQSPEEEFRTLMMMIQATDDKTMLKKALEAAKRINDDKTRAQAMLDVINEINYFTQSQQ